MGLIEIDGLLVPPGKAFTLLTDNQPLRSESAQKMWFKANHPYLQTLLA